MQNSMVVSILSVLECFYLKSRLIWTCKILYWCSFFLVKTFFYKFCPKINLAFDVAWLISPYFSRRDLKPVAFLVLYQILYFSWKNHNIIEMRCLKNTVVFFKIVINFLLFRKIIIIVILIFSQFTPNYLPKNFENAPA